MAFISLASKTWGSGPAITLKPSYEKKRSGANMQYRVKIAIQPMEYSESYFGYPIYMKTYLAGSLKDTHTVKDVSPSQWSSAITYTTPWFTISNKTSGTTELKLNIYSGSGNSRNNTYTYSLAVDPAASVIGTVSNFTIGNAINIPITKYNSNFTDTLVITLGTTTIKTVSGITNGYDVSFTSSELTAIYNKLPNGPDGYFKFTITTKSGSSTLGSSYVYATGTIPSSIKPKVNSVTVTEVGSVPTSWGIHVQNKSKLRFVIDADAGTGTSIKSIKTTINGVTYTGSTINTNIINNWGDHKASITVTDNRNRTVTTTKNVAVLKYGDPYINSVNAFRCDAEGVASNNGTYIRVELNGGVYSLSGKNTASYTVKYKKSASSSYTNYPIDSTAATYNSYVIIPNIDNNSSYNVRVEIKDYFTTTGKTAPLIPGAFRTINFKKGGRGMGIGKMAELDNLLDIGFKTRFYGGLKGVHLPQGADFNDYTTPNTYISEYNFNTGNYVNGPCEDNIAFIFKVDACGPTEAVIKQEVITCQKTNSRRFERYYYATEWGEWIETSRMSRYVNVAGTNLNDYTHTGYYFFPQSCTPTNIPIGVNGWLEVISSAAGTGFTKQIWHRAGTINSNDHDSFIRTSGDGGATWSKWHRIMTSDSYPLNTVLVTATNANPGSIFGGTWTLIDKEFASTGAVSGGFTINSTNVSGHSCYWSRGGHTVTFEIAVTLKVDFADTALNMGKVALSTLGITRFTNTHRILGHSDGGNSAAFLTITTGGEINSADVIPDPYISAGQTVVATFTAVIGKDHMLDSACDKFYWKRTA